MDVKEFLIGWLMEFGTEKVVGSRRVQSEWYMRVDHAPFDPECQQCFDFQLHDPEWGHRLNQKGLDFIKEK